MLLAAIVGLTGVDSAIAAAGAGVLAVLLLARAGDIATFQLNVLLIDETTALRGHGRSLLLALANLAELGLISAGALTALGVPFGRGAVEGLRVATLQSDLVAGGAATTAVLTVTMCTALLVAIGTIGVVIAKIGETFYHK